MATSGGPHAGLVVLVMAAAAFLAGGCEDGPPARPPAVPELAAGTTAHTLAVGGQQRAFRVYRPAGRPSGTAAPLVVMLHGALGDGRQAQSSYGWDARADRGGFLVAYPDGMRRAWAVSPDCCGPPAAAGVDDVAFVTGMVAAISAATPVDPARVFATGISNGGMLAYRLGCESTLFAAIAPVAATLPGSCATPKPVSVIHIHGTADRTIPYRGGPGRRDNGGAGAYPVDTAGPPIPDLVRLWSRGDRCPPPATTTVGDVTTAAAACPEGRGVTLVTIAEAGHQWPGQPGPRGAFAASLDRPSAALDATATIWSFFDSHPKR